MEGKQKDVRSLREYVERKTSGDEVKGSGPVVVLYKGGRVDKLGRGINDHEGWGRLR